MKSVTELAKLLDKKPSEINDLLTSLGLQEPGFKGRNLIGLGLKFGEKRIKNKGSYGEYSFIMWAEETIDFLKDK